MSLVIFHVRRAARMPQLEGFARRENPFHGPRSKLSTRTYRREETPGLGYNLLKLLICLPENDTLPIRAIAAVYMLQKGHEQAVCLAWPARAAK